MAAVRMLGTIYGLHTDQLRILITPVIRKTFTENSSSSWTFPWHPRGHFPSMARCHKGIMDGTDVFTDEKYDP